MAIIGNVQTSGIKSIPKKMGSTRFNHLTSGWTSNSAPATQLTALGTTHLKTVRSRKLSGIKPSSTCASCGILTPHQRPDDNPKVTNKDDWTMADNVTGDPSRSGWNKLQNPTANFEGSRCLSFSNHPHWHRTILRRTDQASTTSATWPPQCLVAGVASAGIMAWRQISNHPRRSGRGWWFPSASPGWRKTMDDMK